MNDLICEAEHVDNCNIVRGYFVKYPDGTASIFPEDEWASYPVKPHTLNIIKSK